MRHLIFGILTASALFAEAANSGSLSSLDSVGEDHVFSRNVGLPSKRVMQSICLDSDGSVWYTQISIESREQMIWVKSLPHLGREPMMDHDGKMTLRFFGHATNVALEEHGADRYLWSGCYGSCNEKGDYWTERLIARVKYVPDKIVTTDKCDDYFYIGPFRDMHPSIDSENGLLAINYRDDRCPEMLNFVVYDLNEAICAPISSVPVNCTDGFMTGDVRSTNRVDVLVEAHDLTKLAPKARFNFHAKGYVKEDAPIYYPWQGFELKGDRVYFAEGLDNKHISGSFDKGCSMAYVIVFDMSGQVVEGRKLVALVSDKDRLAEYSISESGHMESEGIKIKDGYIYLGFSTRRRVASDPYIYHAVLCYKLDLE